jgi:hypothetical protein
MFDSDLVAEAARFAVLGQQIATAVSSETSGPLAADALAEVLAAVRAGELATCRLMERVDRSGEFAVAASTVAYLRSVSGDASGWASQRVQLDRAFGGSDAGHRCRLAGRGARPGACIGDPAGVDRQTLEFTPPDGRPPIRSKRRLSCNKTVSNSCTPNPPSASKPPAGHEISCVVM